LVTIQIPKAFWLISSSTALAFAAIACLQGTAQASAPSSDFAAGSKLLVAPSKILATDAGSLDFAKTDWKTDMQPDGTQLLTYTVQDKKTKKVPEARAAVLRSKEGALESMTTYALSPNEDASTVFFSGKSLAAYSLCEDRGEKEIGRVCVTATPKLCKAVTEGKVTPEIMKEMDVFEMRALAILLTLRGPDHQLENVVKSGNRLGLKSALQTTKGQLLALARQVNKEKGIDRTVASAEQTAMEVKLGIDNKLSKTVLERSLPRLKQACQDTHFN
jgi:hypothetical protein